MKRYPSLKRCLLSLLGAFMLTFLSMAPSESLASGAEFLNTIILINGDAVLVKIDQKGEILKKYINVPEYFSSSRSHESLVQRALGKVKGLSSVHRVYDDYHHFMSSRAIAHQAKNNDILKEWNESFKTNPSQCSSSPVSPASSQARTAVSWTNMLDIYYRPTNRIRPSFSRIKAA